MFVALGFNPGLFNKKYHSLIFHASLLHRALYKYKKKIRILGKKI